MQFVYTFVSILYFAFNFIKFMLVLNSMGKSRKPLFNFIAVSFFSDVELGIGYHLD